MLGRKHLSTSEVAELIGVSPRTITLWAVAWHESGGSEGIPAFKIGKKLWKFDPHEIDRWIALQKNGSAQEAHLFRAIDRKNG